MINEYICEKCGKLFLKKGAYTRHQQRKTPCKKVIDESKYIQHPNLNSIILNSSKQNNSMELTIPEIEALIEKKKTEEAKKVKEEVEEEVKEEVKEEVVSNIVIHHAECLLKMKEIETGSIDMILCDPPYGCTKNKWDVIIPFDKMWEEYNRIIKTNGAIVLFGSQPFTSMLVTSNPKMFRYCLVWEKNKFSDFLNAKRKPMKTNEDMCIFYKKQPTYNPQYTYGEPYKRWNTQKAVDKQTNYGGHKKNVVESKDGRRLPTTVLKFNRVERPKHPTQKPTDLLEWLIKTYSNEGDTVLDNCMGVGSTGVACKNSNRHFIGIELEEEYFKIAQSMLFE